MGNFERSFPLSKDTLDTLNSASWFLMDAFWMLQKTHISYIFITPTIITGLILCYLDKRPSVTLINIAVLSWICMNTSWMIAEVNADESYLLIAKGFLGLGVALIITSLFVSKNIRETFSHFRRFRNNKWV